MSYCLCDDLQKMMEVWMDEMSDLSIGLAAHFSDFEEVYGAICDLMDKLLRIEDVDSFPTSKERTAIAAIFTGKVFCKAHSRVICYFIPLIKKLKGGCSHTLEALPGGYETDLHDYIFRSSRVDHGFGPWLHDARSAFLAVLCDGEIYRNQYFYQKGPKAGQLHKTRYQVGILLNDDPVLIKKYEDAFEHGFGVVMKVWPPFGSPPKVSANGKRQRRLGHHSKGGCGQLCLGFMNIFEEVDWRLEDLMDPDKLPVMRHKYEKMQEIIDANDYDEGDRSRILNTMPWFGA